MEPGRLRHRVTFEELTVTQDTDGAQEESWTPLFDRPISCEIKALSGRELIAAQAVQSKVSTRIVTRYRPGFKPSMRALHRGVVYGVEAVIPDPESGIHWVTLMCTSGLQFVNEG